MTRIDPPVDLKRILARVENPGRYTGGEFGALEPRAAASGEFVVALCFPDLYEIGMSNTAIKLLYTRLNAIDGVRCERAFAPAPDFESELSAAEIPLYTLESGIPLSDCDLVAFSVGYELSATNILTILERGGIPRRAADRGAGSPLVIGGGPVFVNPVPFGVFFDGVFIGEAEEELERLVAGLAEMKRRGATRGDRLTRLRETPHLWWPGAPRRVRRAIWTGFGEGPSLLHAPVPSIRVVQDHGVVEIMRGCPQGCRFCSAGVFYRPVRMKDYAAIEREVEHLVYNHGYRHITLSSLSTGDYADVQALFRYLNARFASEHVSFALPSLRVNSFTLPLLAEVSQVRKSGLTFAVETPGEAGQLAINKQVPLERTIEILGSAREMGWRLAKFYFMIGLPVPESDEVEEIAAFMHDVRSAVKMNVNVAVATFVPKPHTPFQWARQLGEYEALDRIMDLKHRLKREGIKLGYQAPFQSMLEGMTSRGDERVGELIEDAWGRGCRLDAWEDYLDRDAWRAVIAGAGWDVEGELFRERETQERLPWQVVSTGVGTAALRREFDRSRRGELTDRCAPGCDHPCGVCNTTVGMREAEAAPVPGAGQAPEPDGGAPRAAAAVASATRYRVLFRFEKTGRAVYIPHLGLMGTFERTYRRAGIPVGYTRGFNPKPRQEFAQPLSLGLASVCEYALVSVSESIQAEGFCERMNYSLPAGVRVVEAVLLEEHEKKVPSLMSSYWGADYELELSGADIAGDDLVSALSAAPGVVDVGGAESRLWVRIAHLGGQARGLKKVLTAALGGDPAAFGLSVTRTQTLASGAAGQPVSYFEAYRASEAGAARTAAVAPPDDGAPASDG